MKLKKNITLNEALMFDLLSKILPIIIGWYIILDSSRHITSRNEAKSAIEDILKKIEDCLTESLKDWQAHCKEVHEKQENTVILNIQMMKFTRIKNLNSQLARYAITELKTSQIIDIKKVLTTSPPWKEFDNVTDKQNFLLKKLELSKSVQSKITKLLYDEFYNKYPPVIKPFISTKFKELIIWPSLILILLLIYLEALNIIFL